MKFILREQVSMSVVVFFCINEYLCEVIDEVCSFKQTKQETVFYFRQTIRVCVICEPYSFELFPIGVHT